MTGLEGQNQSTHEDTLSILYQDDELVAIRKPSGVMTHRSRIAEDDDPSAMERLRDQLNTWVYPIHRLDRATSGILLFGLNKESARKLHQSFTEGRVSKNYWMITRGHAPLTADIDRPLKEKRDRITDKKAQVDKPAQAAHTQIETLAHLTLPIPLGRYPTARFSLVQASLKTGRRHQIRRHLAGLNYPIIGDTTHGRGEQNRFFRTHFMANRLMLAAVELTLPHPTTDRDLRITASLSGVMARLCDMLFFGQDGEPFSTELIAKDEHLSIKLDWFKSRIDFDHLLATPQA